MKVLDYLNELAEKQIPVDAEDVIIYGFIKCWLENFDKDLGEFINKYGKPKMADYDNTKIDTEIDVIFKMKGQDDEWHQITAYKQHYGI